MHTGIPVDAADLQYIARCVQKRLKQRFTQFLHRLVQRVGVLLLVR